MDELLGKQVNLPASNEEVVEEDEEEDPDNPNELFGDNFFALAVVCDVLSTACKIWLCWSKESFDIRLCGNPKGTPIWFWSFGCPKKSSVFDLIWL